MGIQRIDPDGQTLPEDDPFDFEKLLKSQPESEPEKPIKEFKYKRGPIRRYKEFLSDHPKIKKVLDYAIIFLVYAVLIEIFSDDIVNGVIFAFAAMGATCFAYHYLLKRPFKMLIGGKCPKCEGIETESYYVSYTGFSSGPGERRCRCKDCGYDWMKMRL